MWSHFSKLNVWKVSFGVIQRQINFESHNLIYLRVTKHSSMLFWLKVFVACMIVDNILLAVIYFALSSTGSVSISFLLHLLVPEWTMFHNASSANIRLMLGSLFNVGYDIIYVLVLLYWQSPQWCYHHPLMSFLIGFMIT